MGGPHSARVLPPNQQAGAMEEPTPRAGHRGGGRLVGRSASHAATGAICSTRAGRWRRSTPPGRKTATPATFPLAPSAATTGRRRSFTIRSRAMRGAKPATPGLLITLISSPSWRVLRVTASTRGAIFRWPAASIAIARNVTPIWPRIAAGRAPRNRGTNHGVHHCQPSGIPHSPRKAQRSRPIEVQSCPSPGARHGARR